MDGEETTAERYQRELNERLEDTALNMPARTMEGPFEEAYQAIAIAIVAITNVYVSLRVIEELLEGES